MMGADCHGFFSQGPQGKLAGSDKSLAETVLLVTATFAAARLGLLHLATTNIVTVLIFCAAIVWVWATLRDVPVPEAEEEHDYSIGLVQDSDALHVTPTPELATGPGSFRSEGASSGACFELCQPLGNSVAPFFLFLVQGSLIK